MIDILSDLANPVSVVTPDIPTSACVLSVGTLLVSKVYVSVIEADAITTVWPFKGVAINVISALAQFPSSVEM